jgi:ABC-2 type transport system ATP-binding protein
VNSALHVRNLSKSYGQLQAVREVNLDVGHGEVFAILGPNGAGKSTTIEILEGHRKRDSGQVSVLGEDPGARAGSGAPRSASSSKKSATPEC